MCVIAIIMLTDVKPMNQMYCLSDVSLLYACLLQLVQAEEITLTLGQAFDLAYQRFLDSSNKNVDMKKQLLMLQKKVGIVVCLCSLRRGGRHASGSAPICCVTFLWISESSPATERRRRLRVNLLWTVATIE